jgi:hypothetical protein
MKQAMEIKDGCSASVTTDKNNKIIKLNNKPVSDIDSLDKLHPKHEPYTDIELNKIKNWENLKNKAINQSGSVMSMYYINCNIILTNIFQSKLYML